MSTFLMRYIFIVFVCLTVLACKGNKGSQYKLDKVEKNMTMMQVVRITGEPTHQEDMGKATDETGDTTHIVIWSYGDNESITFVNGKVNDVDMNIKKTNERIQHIMDSAKAVGG